jgi:threonine 3-dehydrogenase
MGATVAADPRQLPVAEIQKQLGMQEGFDVGLEMSGSHAAFREMIDNMAHGGRIAVLGLPSKPMETDWHKIIFNMLTLRGIYGREMYETWYKMSVLVTSGVDISPVITHRFSYKDYEKGFAAMIGGETGKVILDWTQI